MDHLTFDPSVYEVRTLEMEGRTITFRAFLNRVYVNAPVQCEYQKLNLFVPEAYYQGKSINGYTASTAPIFLPNSIGAYMSGRADEPGPNFRTFARGQINALFTAIERGYVVAAPAARGRDLRSESGQAIGAAPAAIVDLKAAVRYLRHNREKIPGDTEKIISDGTSAGGAMSALLAVSGNAAEYEPYLKELGAAKERDDIFAAFCFCPIMNLQHADMAYEWLLQGLEHFESVHFVKTNGLINMEPWTGEQNEAQKAAGEELRKEFYAYVNGLHLPDGNGSFLQLDENGRGSFYEKVAAYMAKAAQKAIQEGTQTPDEAYLRVENGQLTAFDLQKYMASMGRMKPCPAFDGWDAANPENEEFASGALQGAHFAENSQKHDTAGAPMAAQQVIDMMDPMHYARGGADRAGHMWIRHGAADRHTSWAVPVLFAEALKASGVPDVNMAFAWKRDHSGDYDMPQMFDWADAICKEET